MRRPSVIKLDRRCRRVDRGRRPQGHRARDLDPQGLAALQAFRVLTPPLYRWGVRRSPSARGRTAARSAGSRFAQNLHQGRVGRSFATRSARGSCRTVPDLVEVLAVDSRRAGAVRRRIVRIHPCNPRYRSAGLPRGAPSTGSCASAWPATRPPITTDAPCWANLPARSAALVHQRDHLVGVGRPREGPEAPAQRQRPADGGIRDERVDGHGGRSFESSAAVRPVAVKHAIATTSRLPSAMSAALNGDRLVGRDDFALRAGEVSMAHASAASAIRTARTRPRSGTRRSPSRQRA